MKFFLNSYFWNGRKVVKDIKENRIDEKYQLFAFFLFSLAPLFSAMEVIHQSAPILISVLRFIFTCIGVTICFHTNSKLDNKDFLKRFFCLSIPASTRSLVLMSPITLTLTVVANLLIWNFYNIEYKNPYISFSISQLITFYYFKYINTYLKKFDHANRSLETPIKVKNSLTIKDWFYDHWTKLFLGILILFTIYSKVFNQHSHKRDQDIWKNVYDYYDPPGIP